VSAATLTADGAMAEWRRVPRSFEAVLARLQAEAATHFGIPDVQVVPAGFERRALTDVLRVAIREPGRADPRTHLFVKILRPRPSLDIEAMQARIVRDFETTRRIHEAMARWEDVGAVRPVTCYPDELAIVTEETRGETFNAYIGPRLRWFSGLPTLDEVEAVATRTGRWLQAFQTIDARPDKFSLDELRSSLDLRLERLARTPRARWGSGDRMRTVRHVDRLMARVTQADLAEVLVHADFAPGNVIVAGSRIVVLDFAMTRRSSRLHDIARLHAQIELLCAKPQFRPASVARVQRALLRGFDPDLTARHPLFRLLLMLHRVNHLSSLSMRRERFPASVYNAHLRRLHRRWIRDELSGDCPEGDG
jgi:hypothetical protein